MNKLSTLECRTRIDHLEDDFENSHNFVAQVFATCILFFLLAYNQNLMIFGKNYAFHRKNMFFLSIIFSLICVVLSFQYFILYYKHYTNLDNLCDFKKLLPTTYIFRYQIPLIVSIGFIIISLGLSVMIFMNIFS
jgi:hypothetical protein